MAITINTTDDLLEALRGNPDFHSAARREFLTESLIGLPEETTEIRAEMAQWTERIQGRLDSLREHDVELKMSSNLRRQVEYRFGLTRVRGIWSSRVYIQPPNQAERFSSEVDRGIDNRLIEDGLGRILLDTDLVTMARRGETTVYVPAEASRVVSDDDIERVRDSAALLRRLYPEAEVVPAVYGYIVPGSLVRFDDAVGLERVHIFLDDSAAWELDDRPGKPPEIMREQEWMHKPQSCIMN